MSGRGGLQDTDPGGRASLLEWGSSIKSSSVCADEVPVVLWCSFFCNRAAGRWY